ncbi:hypothetical protein F3Y22_tig00112344pilonHSYRG00006 [Hibiscus syriacus]|uniref:Uncharacterized protein n=1 Tax=Hibiscus syriacus TaxID=106335 RepID=A0A6A2XZH8_HIBSY|nr:hypothetical protein F3Y22_tig00112344pilonHSYRG00006 [Hibiscus syriacus]
MSQHVGHPRPSERAMRWHPRATERAMRGNPSNRARVGRHVLRATYPRSVALGFPRIARSVALACPLIARSDGFGRMASVGWPRMPSVMGRAWRPTPRDVGL